MSLHFEKEIIISDVLTKKISKTGQMYSLGLQE